MAESNDKQPVLAVVGPTATGKTALGVELALRLGGEIISADSMQIYRGLDIGTAKVTPEETRGVPHHCVDILPPEAPFSVADFTALAGRLVEEIGARGRLPILVGGTGLYVQSFLNGVRFAEEKAPDGLRDQLTAELAARGPDALYAELQAVDPEAAAAIHPHNHVRVLRALEHYRATGRRLSEQKAASPAAGAALPRAGAGAGFPPAGRPLPPHRRPGGPDDGAGPAGGGPAGLGPPPELPHRRPGHRIQRVFPFLCGGGHAGTLRRSAQAGVPPVRQTAADLVPPYGRGGLAGGRQPRLAGQALRLAQTFLHEG